MHDSAISQHLAKHYEIAVTIERMEMKKERLERALTAVISTPSLVGSLTKQEVEFFAMWLALAYC